MATINAEDRVSRVRQLFNPGTASVLSKTHVGSNLLLGIAQHGLARRSQGHSLSALEKLAVSPFEALAREEAELDEYGKAAMESKTSRAMTGVIPMSILDLPKSEPYDRERLAKDMKDMMDEVVRQPHIRVLSVNEFKERTVEDNAKFNDATARLKRGLTFFYPDPKSESQDASTAIAGQQNWEKDEIYWSWASAADSRQTREERTKEFGSIVTGKTRYFDGDHAHHSIFNGVVPSILSTTIVCWEADNSSNPWYLELERTMREISRISGKFNQYTGIKWIDFLIGLLPGVENYKDFIWWIEQISGLTAALLNFFVNPDDLVQQLTLAWSLEAIEQQSAPGEPSFMFDGGTDGKHELWLRRGNAYNSGCERLAVDTIDSLPPRLTGEYKIMPMQAIEGPSIGARFPIPICCYRNHNNNDIVYSPTLDTPPKVLPGAKSRSRPMMARKGTLTCIAYRGMDEGIYVASTNTGINWETVRIGNDAMTCASPGICILRDMAVCFCYDVDNYFYVSTRHLAGPVDGWSGWYEVKTSVNLVPQATAVLDENDGLVLWWTKDDEDNICLFEITREALVDKMRDTIRPVYRSDSDGYKAASSLSPHMWEGKRCVLYRNRNIWDLELLVRDPKDDSNNGCWSMKSVKVCGDPTLYQKLGDRRLYVVYSRDLDAP
ncbi:hypothetical protein BDV23DRAFT_189375 [Aspergillus alliaceus]|uniref:Uncharacterized protein n=1 Tax=Petromyces alliaceus TaxID=209559 RepID=A0A5N7BR67_PETAA|nr:hypothetical protein BDV23DRAFT_189375 [Aspergillus alliaceus]